MGVSVGQRPASAKRGRRASVDANTVRDLVKALQSPALHKDGNQDFVISDVKFKTVKDARNEAAKYKRFLLDNSLVEFPLTTSAWEDGNSSYWGIRPGKEKAATNDSEAS